MATPEKTLEQLREIELSLAYEHAGSLIESSCLCMGGATDDEGRWWYDLGSAEIDLEDEVAYLSSRGLLDRHETQPGWVAIRDEAEPLPGPIS